MRSNASRSIQRSASAERFVSHSEAITPPLPSTPNPAERIPYQQGTDYAYIRSLADVVGFRFTLDPGPAPASSLAYWGPEPRADRSRPSLLIDVGNTTNVEAFQLSFD